MSGRGKRFRVEPKSQTNRLESAAGHRWLSGLALPDLAIGIGLILSIVAVYAQVSRFDFINYDDDVYVYKNVHAQQGLTPESVKWAFTAVVSANWMPVTLLSHLLDGQFFHLQSGMHHLVNVLLHTLSALLLFAALRRATGARWPSAFVAFVFALHPLHVGSVAWVAERKDVLSAFFFFLALYFYVRYTERPGVLRYLIVAGLFCLGLMSKPMLVTFPFVLLLLDFWPLQRLQSSKIIWEKVPLLSLAAGAAAVTYFVQRSAGAVHAIPFATRIENALISYVTYIGQLFWPVRLAIFYPYPKAIAVWQAAAPLAVILGVSALAFVAWRTRPYLTMGWLWYLGTLIPVIGLVQVGDQSHADRYTYLPLAGLSVMLAWSGSDIIAKWPRTKLAVAAAATVACMLLMADARVQAAYWQNSETLFQRAIDVTEDNSVAQRDLGGYLMDQPGRSADAIPYLEAAVRLQPDNPDTHNDLGACLLDAGRAADAIPQFEAVVHSKPDLAEAHFNLALALSKVPGRTADAIAQYQAVLRLKPDNAIAHQSLGLLLVKLGRATEAIPYLEAAVRLNPDYSSEYNLGVVLLNAPGRQSDALAHLEAAQRLHPDPEVARTIEHLRAGKK